MSPTGTYIRPAKIRDVPRMLELINEFARQGIMLPRGPQLVFENVRDYLVLVDDKENVYGTGAFHVLWEDVGEVCAVSVDRKLQGKGYGGMLVRGLIEEARRLEIPRVYTFTLVPEFFKKLGFKPVRKEELPQKLYADCSHCPKYFSCDETALVIDFSQEES